MGYLLLSRLDLTGTGIALTVGWLLMGRGIRGISHLKRHPWEIFLLPLLAVMVIIIALPIKTYALLTMNKQGWLTRSENQTGGAGQTASTLAPAEVS
jgi:hypothetical protein